MPITNYVTAAGTNFQVERLQDENEKKKEIELSFFCTTFLFVLNYIQ